MASSFNEPITSGFTCNGVLAGALRSWPPKRAFHGGGFSADLSVVERGVDQQ